MYRISIPALVIAFFAELAADWVIQVGLLLIFGGGSLNDDMSPEQIQNVFDTVSAMPAFTAAIVILGTGTTFGGGYLAARIARQYPYYHGLGMGLAGMAYILYFWKANPLWMNLLGLLSNVPVSIYGAHVAKRHMPAPE